ncbi:MAG: discoidin domain-containing protein [Candidatus Auribacterota bacterium]|nr:discoidin domain-containing protein [Candidatus Auribacterota bacterium]
MEKFSRKEKIALVIFGMILLAIIIQMIWRLGEYDSNSEEGIIINKIGMIFPGNLLKPEWSKMTASSHNKKNEVVSKLWDSNPQTFWHVSLKRLGEPAWVTVDFGEGNKKVIRSIMALPRHDLPRQFFRKAELFGSDNGEDWQLVSNIIQKKKPERATWREWKFDNKQAYRYYQLLITDGYEGGDDHHFFSMAELALFE